MPPKKFDTNPRSEQPEAKEDKILAGEPKGKPPKMGLSEASFLMAQEEEDKRQTEAQEIENQNSIGQIPSAEEVTEFSTAEGRKEVSALADKIDPLILEADEKVIVPKSSVDEEGADLEAQLQAINELEIGVKTETEDIESSNKSPEKSEWRELKSAFRQSQKEYYDTLTKNAGFGTRWFGLGRNKMNDEVRESYDKFMSANKAFYGHAQDSGHYGRAQKRLDKFNQYVQEKSLAENPSDNELEDDSSVLASESIASKIADRHIFKPAEERLERQTSSVSTPESIRKLKEKIVSGISNNKLATATVGGLAVMAGVAFAPVVMTTAAVAATTGLALKYGVNKGMYKLTVESAEGRMNSRKESVVDGIGTKSEINLEDLEAEAFSVRDYLQSQKTKIKITSRVVGIGAAVAAGGLTAASLYDEAGNSVFDAASTGDIDVSGMPQGGAADAPDYTFKENPYQIPKSEVHENFVSPLMHADPVGPPPPPADGRVYLDSIGEGLPEVEPRPEMPSFEDTLDENPQGRGNFVANPNSYGMPSLENSVPNIDATNESLLNTLETVEPTHTVKSGENLSSILSHHINVLVDNGQPLPDGVDKNGLTHYMYQSFPEMTSASDITPRMIPQDWIDVGVKSGNPHLIRPGEIINMEALAEKMWGATTDPSAIDVDVSVISPENGDVLGAEGGFTGSANGAESAGIEGLERVDPATESIDVTEATPAIEMKPIMSESLAEEIHAIARSDEKLQDHLVQMINKGVGNGTIILPDQLMIGDTDYRYNLLAYVEAKLPDIGTLVMGNRPPNLFSPDTWESLGVASGDPTNLSVGDNVKVGKLLEFVFTFDPASLDASNVAEAVGETGVSQAEAIDVATSAEGMNDVIQELEALKDKLPQNVAGEYITSDGREQAIIIWDGGEFAIEDSMDIAPTDDAIKNEALNQLRGIVPQGSRGSQELINGVLTKEVWVQPDGKMRVVEFNPEGGFSFSVY